MKVTWDEGFKRVRWGFLALAWLGFIAAHWTSSAAQWGEDAVYMLFFTGGVVIFARLCIWIVRGFFGRAKVSG